MKIIIDAMGSDKAPYAQIEGSVFAVNNIDGIQIILVGNEEVLRDGLSKFKYEENKIIIKHAQDIITNDDEPTKAIKTKKDASMVVAANMLKNGEGDAMVSMANTGALLAVGLLIVGRIKGVLRPALAPVIPTRKGAAMLIDAGANTDCKPANLLQFATMGSVYMSNVLGYSSPTVGLVNIGEEEKKGNELAKSTYPLMQKAPFNFIGNIEGREVIEGKAQVIVCDGFVGNVILKVIEGMGSLISKGLKDIFFKNIMTKIGAVLVKKGIDDFKKTMDYTEYGGAPLMGTKKPVIKGHGSSNAKAVYSAILQAKKFVETGIIEKIEKQLEELEVGYEEA